MLSCLKKNDKVLFFNNFKKLKNLAEENSITYEEMVECVHEMKGAVRFLPANYIHNCIDTIMKAEEELFMIRKYDEMLSCCKVPPEYAGKYITGDAINLQFKMTEELIRNFLQEKDEDNLACLFLAILIWTSLARMYYFMKKENVRYEKARKYIIRDFTYYVNKM